MYNNKMNKRGAIGDQVMFAVFIFLMVVIAVGIVAGVFIFFGNEYDYKQISSDVLNYNIRNCLSNNDINSIFNNLYEKCGLNANVLENKTIIKICMNSNDCISDGNPKFVQGSNFVQCGLSGITGNANYPKCTIKEISVNGVVYTIITGSKMTKRISNE